MAITGHKFLQEIGERITRLRKEQNVTQAQLAELLGVSQQLVAFYERGLRRMPIDLLPRAAHVLGVSVEGLLGLKPENGKRGPTPRLQHQLERISRLPRAKQRLVMEMLDGVLSQASQ